MKPFGFKIFNVNLLKTKVYLMVFLINYKSFLTLLFMDVIAKQ